jgi:uncharacterized PurR-regulated membrane protein YhhQ (DUF165 family)
MNTIKRELDDYKLLLRNVPSTVTALLILSVVCMNLLANKELFASQYFCINCGLALSWISFLCMDCICKRFGARASVKISILALILNLITTVIFWLLSLTPGHWAAFYSASDPATAELINAGLNSTFGGAWYVVVGSSIAMLASSIVNAVTNHFVGEAADKGGYGGFAVRSFISTGIGQWVDNFVFSVLVSHVFFGWNWTQVIICSTTSMIIELALEAIFSPFGYKVTRMWEDESVGEDYLSHPSALI